MNRDPRYACMMLCRKAGQIRRALRQPELGLPAGGQPDIPAAPMKRPQECLVSACRLPGISVRLRRWASCRAFPWLAEVVLVLDVDGVRGSARCTQVPTATQPPPRVRRGPAARRAIRWPRRAPPSTCRAGGTLAPERLGCGCPASLAVWPVAVSQAARFRRS
jgi:hypothetical protein